MTDIFDFLRTNSISYERHDHAAVFTCAQSNELAGDIPGGRTKNLFLRNEKGDRHFLLVVADDKRADLKKIGIALGVKKLGFASPERLQKYLGVEVGAVTALALINDRDHAVELLIDRDLWSAESLHCHPLVNTATLVIPQQELRRFFSLTEHVATVIDIPVLT